MKTAIFVWLIMMVYSHIARYVELDENSTVNSFKDYVNYQNKRFYIILFTQIMFLFLAWFWELVFNL